MINDSATSSIQELFGLSINSCLHLFRSLPRLLVLKVAEYHLVTIMFLKVFEISQIARSLRLIVAVNVPYYDVSAVCFFAPYSHPMNSFFLNNHFFRGRFITT